MSILARVNPVYHSGGKNGLIVGGTTLLPGEPSDIVNEYATAGRAALEYQRQADSALQSAIGAAQGGVSAANQAAANAQSYITNMNQYAGQAAQSAAGIGTAITNVNNAAGQVNQSAAALTPYAATLNNYGQQVYGQGLNLYCDGQGYLNSSSDIMGLNADAGGLTGQYVQALMAINPDRYVSMAASDVQSSYKNVADQMKRDLARSGVDVGSGRYAGMWERYSSLLATSLAGAKTRARQMGVTERLGALQSGFGVAQNLATTGSGIMTQGGAMQAQGGGLVNQAAGVTAQRGQLEATSGQLYGQAGQLHGTAGQLGATQANAYTSAASSVQNAGQLVTSAANAKVSAENALAGAQQNAAQYYAQVSQGWGQIAGENGLMRALFASDEPVTKFQNPWTEKSTV